jgi:hypothetical protein
MYERHKEPLAPRRIFIKRIIRSFSVGLVFISVSLFLGMWGYHHFEKMSWIDAYLNASMILSGMGPADPVKTTIGKIFAGTYALFSGIIFLVIIAIIFAPLFHRFFHKLHLEEKKDTQ